MKLSAEQLDQLPGDCKTPRDVDSLYIVLSANKFTFVIKCLSVNSGFLSPADQCRCQ